MDVAAIDLERMKRGDRMFDAGRVAGELQHAFMSAAGDRHRAESFIRYFFWEYSCHFPDHQRTFASVTARAPYYMALNLLRIARNDYIDRDYGGKLVAQAKKLLQVARASGSRACQPHPVRAGCKHGHPSGRVRRVWHPGQDPDRRRYGRDLPRRGALPHLPGHRPVPDQVRDLYFRTMSEQRQASPEEHPELDAAGMWHSIIRAHQTAFTSPLPRGKLRQMPLFLAEMCRGISRHELGLYPHVHEVLDALRARYPLALVTDAQSTCVCGELHRVGLLGYFDPIVVSGDHGYRKPDRRLFQFALDGIAVAAENALYVGNDMHRDIFGARGTGPEDCDVRLRPGQEGLPGLRTRLHDYGPPRDPGDSKNIRRNMTYSDCATECSICALPATIER